MFGVFVFLAVALSQILSNYAGLSEKSSFFLSSCVSGSEVCCVTLFFCVLYDTVI